VSAKIARRAAPTTMPRPPAPGWGGRSAIDTSAAPLTFVSSAQLPLIAGAAIAFWTIVGLVIFGRQRRVAPARLI